MAADIGGRLYIRQIIALERSAKEMRTMASEWVKLTLQDGGKIIHVNLKSIARKGAGARVLVKAPVGRSEPNTLVHSSNGRFEVTAAASQAFMKRTASIAPGLGFAAYD